MKIAKLFNLNEKGAVLITGLMFLLFLTIIGATALLTTTNDVTISANYKSVKEAFYNAEAGVHFASTAIENGIKSWTFTMPSSTSPTVSLQTALGSAPSDYSFTLSDLTYVSYNNYSFRSTGTGSRGANAQIEARIRRGVGVTMGAFGDKLLDLDSFSGYYSYDSNVTSSPDSGTSTGQGDVGSNGIVNPGATANGIVVDGDVIFGNNGTVDAAYNDPAKPVQSVTGTDGEYIGRIDPDPLGMMDGHLTDEVNHYADALYHINDDLGLATDTISGAITLSTPGNYYFEEITGLNIVFDPAAVGDINIYVPGKQSCINLGSSDVIDIDYGGTNNKVQIFVSDNGVQDNKTLISAGNSAAINGGNRPTQFGIFTDSDAKIEIKNGGEFRGLVYAPIGYLDIKNGGNFYGAAWGSTFDSNNSAALYFDINMADAFAGKEIQLTSWVQINN